VTRETTLNYAFGEGRDDDGLDQDGGLARAFVARGRDGNSML
jgi:hypothetical protein